MATRQQRRAGGSGQSVVELALVLPVLCLLLLGIAEFGRLFSEYLTVQHAAREGLRLGITGGTDAQIRDRVLGMATGLNPDRLTVTISPADAARTPGSDLQVTVVYRFQTLTPLVGSITGSTLSLQASVVSRVE